VFAIAIVLSPVLSTGCGDEALHVRYEAERHLWRADRDRAALPGNPVGDGYEQWEALAARYESIAAHYGSWASDPDVPESYRADLLRITGRAWLRAVDLRVGCADSLGARDLLDAVIDRFDGTAVAIEMHLRSSGVALADGDSTRAVEHLRRVWSAVRDSDRNRRAHLDIPARVARLTPQPPRPTAPVYTWALAEYRGVIEGGRHREATLATLELAELALDFDDISTALESLRPLTASILARREPEPGDARTMRRIVETMAGAMARGELEREALDPALEWALDNRADAGRTLTAVAGALRERGQLDRALAIYERIPERHDDAEWAPRALMSVARIHTQRGKWDQAFVSLKLLEARYALTAPALEVPLEIVALNRRRGERTEALEALLAAERTYRRLMDRFPPGNHSDHLLELLIETLERQGRYAEAHVERLVWIDRAAGSVEELHRLRASVEAARANLLGEELIEPLVRRMAERFPNTRLGRRAAHRLAEGNV
jgi:tetratricopeptide (TPR) repeat protein